MAYDVFISYSSRDKATADAVCHAIEADGVRCWIAPRDLLPGRTWKQSIVPAIREARMMVLIFSDEANSSPQVRREVDIAFEADVPILPFRIEDVEMSDDLYYCIAARHWLDALTDPKDEQIKKLVVSVRALADTERITAVDPPSLEEQAPLATDHSSPQPSARVHTENGALKRLSKRLGSAAARRIAIGILAIAFVLVGRALLSGPSASKLAEQGVAAYDAEDYTAALPLLIQSAEKGDSEAQYTLGRMYFYGWGVAKDEDRALELFRAAADQGNPGGQTGLGVLYSRGEAVELDDEEAVRWYRLAADQGHARAQNNLGYMYQTGRGVDADTAEAVRLYRTAAEAGDAQGQVNIGYMYQYGIGVEVDLEEAARFYELAARQGHVGGQLNLGWLYGRGEGVPRNYGEQLKWYRLAAQQGDTTAQNNLKILQDRPWPAGALMPGAWTTLDAEARSSELDRFATDTISSRLEGWDLERVRSLRVDFYDDASLYEIELRRDDERAVFTYLRTGSRTTAIDGQSPQIHSLNAEALLRIESIHQAVAYLRFFVGALKGAEGRFQVVEEVDDLLWLPDAADADREAIAGKLRLLDIAESPEGGWRGSGTLVYTSAVFDADFELAERGMVEMLNDTTVAADLPVFIESFDESGIRTRAAADADDQSN